MFIGAAFSLIGDFRKAYLKEKSFCFKFCLQIWENGCGKPEMFETISATMPQEENIPLCDFSLFRMWGTSIGDCECSCRPFISRLRLCQNICC
jgi:hypothetical protein